MIIENGRRDFSSPIHLTASGFALCFRCCLPCSQAPGPTSSKNFVLFQSRTFGTRPFEELRSSRVSGFQPSTSSIPGMITWASTPAPTKIPVMSTSFSNVIPSGADQPRSSQPRIGDLCPDAGLNPCNNDANQNTFFSFARNDSIFSFVNRSVASRIPALNDSAVLISATTSSRTGDDST